MSSSSVRMVIHQDRCSAVLAMVELDRVSGVASGPETGRVDLVDHVGAWVLEGGIVLGAVLRRSLICNGRLLGCRDVSPVVQTALSETERLDVLHAAGLRMMPAVDPGPRWEVA